MDTTVLDIRLISREEYEMFVKDKDYNMFQHPRYLRFMEERGYQPRIYGGFQEGTLVIALIVRIDPLMKVFKSARSLREWVTDRPEDAALIKAFVNGLTPLLRQEGLSG